MNVRVKFDTSKIQEAIKNLALHVKKSRKEWVEESARGFVRIVAEVTPPASKGKSGSTAKKQGEAAILGDLARVMQPVRSGKNRPLNSPGNLYKRFRDRRTGRLNSRGLRQPYPVSSTEFSALKKLIFSRIGWLASGWNTAAKKLGVRLPAWIARHGTGAGVITVTNGERWFRIEISNTVKFVGNVKNLDRRIQKAILYQASAVQRKADFLLRKAVKKAGF